ncbi:type IV pilus assembly protein PilM [Patescibacteria group bacterium]|nr:type IV pilus assembly protein PilM [Patescibacteria group bacterium]MBU4098133.1 type IV pilus assembly protein PilM [Patescibacteria group bacterium]
MKNAVFGLDIGITTMRACWLENDKKGIKYISALSAPTPVKSMSSESPLDHQELAAAINKLVIDAKITTNNVSIALPENRVYTKVIDMPNLSEKELSSAIYWEAEQYIPASLDTMTLDWSILKKIKSGQVSKKMQVLLVAAPIQTIKRYQSILELAGLSITSIETEILSVIRSLVSDENFPTSLIMNIGALNTSVSIVQNGSVVFTYIIPLGGIALTRAISADFGFALPQAEEYKKIYGLMDSDFGGKISNAIQPILFTMVTEIKKAINFYSDKYQNEFPIVQLLLTGGSASLAGIDSYFVKNIGIETVIGNPWKLLNIQGVPKDIESRGPEFAVSIGLALKDYE